MGTYREDLERDCGDFLLRRSDGLFAYQLAVVADDAAMGVTEVVRGADLLPSTPRQLLLYRLLWLTPPAFYHFPLLLTAEGRRLSKRDADAGLDTLGERCTAPSPGEAGVSGGIQPLGGAPTAEELLADFDWRRCRGETSASRRGCSETKALRRKSCEALFVYSAVGLERGISTSGISSRLTTEQLPPAGSTPPG